MVDQNQVVQIASLLASRLCHDLVNPVGALTTGLDVLEEDNDPEMQIHAMNLIKESADKTIAVLSFTRLAFGASGSFDGELDTAEVRRVSKAYYAHVKADLEWALPEAPLPKARGRALMNILMLAEKSAPRAGSVVRVEMRGSSLVVVATGPKTKVSDDLRACLSGQDDGLQAKETPGYLAWLLAEYADEALSVEAVSEQEVLFTLTPRAAESANAA